MIGKWRSTSNEERASRTETVLFTVKADLKHRGIATQAHLATPRNTEIYEE